MCRKKGRLMRSLSPILGLSIATALWLNSNQAFASQSPGTCNANNLTVNISKNGNNLKNGQSVTFTISVSNPNDPTTCDLTLGPAGLIFNCPGPLGLADGTQTVLVPGGTTMFGGGVGFGPLTIPVTC